MLLQESTRKKEIIEHAAHLFRIKGYAGTSMRDLASAVGMEAASLYNHMSGKQQLLEIICRNVAERHATHLTKLDSIGGSAIEKIEWLLREHIRVNLGIPEMASVAEDEWNHLEDSYKEIFLNLRKDYENTLFDLLVLGKKEGGVKGFNNEILLYTILSSLQWLHHWYRQQRSISPEDVEREIIEMILSGIKK